MRIVIICLAIAALVSLILAAIRLMRYAHEAKQPRACSNCSLFKAALCTQDSLEEATVDPIVV